MTPTDDTIRALMRASVQGTELEPSLVLADALQETDRPDLGEDLALVLAGRRMFPRAERGLPLEGLAEKERALRIIFRRLDRRFNWDDYHRRERQLGLNELAEIEQSWREATPMERREEIQSTVDWLETEAEAGMEKILMERAEWLFNGSFGHGAELLADEIADTPPPKRGHREANREAMLFQLLLAFDGRLPPDAINQVWRQLSPPAKAYATRVMRDVLRTEGVEITSRPARGGRT